MTDTRVCYVCESPESRRPNGVWLGVPELAGRLECPCDDCRQSAFVERTVCSLACADILRAVVMAWPIEFKS